MNTLAPFESVAMCAPLLGEAELSTQITAWAVVLLATGLLLTPNFRVWITGVMAALLAALVVGIGLQLSSPLMVGTVLGAMGLICVLPPSRHDLRIVGALFFVAALGFYGYATATSNVAPATSEIIEWVVFAVLALITVGAALAMVASRSAVYSAIWFAMTLLATGGLFLFQGAEFLGVATVVVYAGAIVVTFLFVIMLAQPDGHAPYDRISWGWFAKPTAALAAALLMGTVLYALEQIGPGGLRETVAATVNELNRSQEPLPISGDQVVHARLVGAEPFRKLQLQLRPTSDEATTLSTADQERLASAVAKALDLSAPTLSEETTPSAALTITMLEPLPPAQDVLTDEHMARLGGYLFSRQLIAVELAGTLLLAALVGAVAMLSQGAAARGREGDVRV